MGPEESILRVLCVSLVMLNVRTVWEVDEPTLAMASYVRLGPCGDRASEKAMAAREKGAHGTRIDELGEARGLLGWGDRDHRHHYGARSARAGRRRDRGADRAMAGFPELYVELFGGRDLLDEPSPHVSRRQDRQQSDSLVEYGPALLPVLGSLRDRLHGPEQYDQPLGRDLLRRAARLRLGLHRDARGDHAPSQRGWASSGLEPSDVAQGLVRAHRLHPQRSRGVSERHRLAAFDLLGRRHLFRPRILDEAARALSNMVTAH